jgi:hypothetical protein
LIRPDKEYFSTASEYSAFRTGEKEGIPFIPYTLLIDIYMSTAYLHGLSLQKKTKVVYWIVRIYLESGFREGKH